MKKWIEDDNFDIRYEEIKKMSFIERYRNIYFVSDLSCENIKKLEELDTNFVKDFSKNKPFYLKNKIFNIVHFFNSSNKNIYRRDKLNLYLNNKFKVLNLNANNFKEYIYNDFDFLKEIEKQKPLIIFSDYDKDIFKKIYNINNNIIYDIYDINKEIDDELLNNFKIITCSSKKQFDLINNKNKIYIPNGCTVKEYKPVDKYKTKTAVYCGCNINKIDFNLLNLLKALNEDWNIEVIGIPEDRLEQIKDENPDLIIKRWMNEEELHKELSYCHLGLCLLEINDVTKGQLSDKFFNYINAHIPMLVNEELMENYKDYKDFVSPLDFDKLELDNYLKNIPDEKYNELLKECDWDNRFDQMMNIVKEQGLLSE